MSVLGTNRGEFAVSLQINAWVSKSQLLMEKLYSLLSYFVIEILLCCFVSTSFRFFFLPSFLTQCSWHSVSLDMQAPVKKTVMLLKATLWYILDDTKNLLPCNSVDSKGRGSCMAFHQIGLHLASRLPALSCLLKSCLGASGAF